MSVWIETLSIGILIRLSLCAFRGWFLKAIRHRNNRHEIGAALKSVDRISLLIPLALHADDSDNHRLDADNCPVLQALFLSNLR
jgi:hypothetical protein